MGDLDKPKLVFVFDEAHLLFDDAPPALQQRIEQVVRIIRSKGVGVYFCSQFPDDVPDDILGQLGNRVQHALRAYTPRDQKAVRTAAETFVANPEAGRGQDDLATRHRRGAGVDAAGQRRADAGRTHPGRAAALPHGLDHRCRTRAGARRQRGRRQVRQGRRPRLGFRNAGQARRARRRARQGAARGHAASRTKQEGGMGQKISEWMWGTKRRQGMVEAASKQAARTVTNRIVRGVLGGILGGR